MKTKNKIEISGLEALTILFLGLPLVLFCISWLKWYWALILIIMLLFPQLFFTLKLKSKPNWAFLIIAFLLSMGFCLLMGYGELFPQSGDWGKHNAIFSILYRHWNQPVFLEDSGEKIFLCYGLGFYMVPSWTARFFDSFTSLRWLVLLNASFGIFLVVLWINRIWKINLAWIILIFLLGNFDWIKQLYHALQDHHSLQEHEDSLQIFWMIGREEFFYGFDQLPQHAIPMLLFFLVCYESFQLNRLNLIIISCLFVYALFWSPFVLVLLLPIGFMIITNLKLQIKWMSLLVSLSMSVVMVFLAFYYAANLSESDLHWNLPHSFKQSYHLIANHILWFGLAFGTILWFGKNVLSPLEKKLIWVMTSFLLLVSLLHFGYFNDLSGKGVYIPFFVLNLFLVLVTIRLIKKSSWKKNVMIGFLAIAALMPSKIVTMKIIVMAHKSLFDRFPPNSYLLHKYTGLTLKQVLEEMTIKHGYPFYNQYKGSCEMGFCWFLKEKDSDK
jgi:hypothetical protein